MDLIILVVHFGLHRAVTDFKPTKQDEVFGCLKCATTLGDLVKHLVPLLDLLAKHFVNQVFLLVNIPEGLVVAPGFHVVLCFSKDCFYLLVDRFYVKLIAHFYK